MGQIYILTNKINLKKYVGQTKNKAKNRIRKHTRLAEKGKGFIISSAIKKWGANNFEIKTFDIPSELLNDFEIQLIEKLNTLAPNGYNLESGGKKNQKVNEETKKKISESLRGHLTSNITKKLISEAVTGEKNPMYGKEHAQEVKSEMSISQLERWDDDLRERYSEMYKGEKNPFYGKKHSEKTIEGNREKHLGKNNVRYGKHHTKEVRDRISLAHKGKVLSEDIKKKIGEANKGHIAWNKGKMWDKETRSKISESVSKYKMWDVWVNSKGRVMFKDKDGKRKRVNLKNIPTEIKDKLQKINKR